jgi:hypothetical protein
VAKLFAAKMDTADAMPKLPTAGIQKQGFIKKFKKPEAVPVKGGLVKRLTGK